MTHRQSLVAILCGLSFLIVIGFQNCGGYRVNDVLIEPATQDSGQLSVEGEPEGLAAMQEVQGGDSVDFQEPEEPAGPNPSTAPEQIPSPTPSPTPGPAASPIPSPTPGPAASPTPSPTPGPAASPTPSPTPGPANSNSETSVPGRTVGVINQSQTVMGDLKVLTDRPKLGAGVQIKDTSLCFAQGGKVIMKKSSAGLNPYLRMFNMFGPGQIELVDIVLGGGNEAFLKAGGIISGDACPVLSLEWGNGVEILEVRSPQLRVTGKLSVIGALIIRSGASVVVDSGIISLGTPAGEPGIVWMEDGSNLVLNGNPYSFIGSVDANSGQHGVLMVDKGATIRVEAK